MRTSHGSTKQDPSARRSKTIIIYPFMFFDFSRNCNHSKKRYKKRFLNARKTSTEHTTVGVDSARTVRGHTWMTCVCAVRLLLKPPLFAGKRTFHWHCEQERRTSRCSWILDRRHLSAARLWQRARTWTVATCSPLDLALPQTTSSVSSPNLSRRTCPLTRRKVSVSVSVRDTGS